MKLEHLWWTLGIAFGVAFFVWAIDGMSMEAALELQDATVVSVSVGTVTGWNDNNRTYVKYGDGYIEPMRGLLGSVGDRVRTYRTIGTCSAFGIMGDMTRSEAGRIRMASVRGGAE